MVFKAHQPGFENSAPSDARPSGIGLERAAELARGPALRPRRSIPGQGGGGAAPASRENAANGPPRARREKFISLFNLSLIHSFSLPRIFDKGGKVLSLHFVARLSYLSTRSLGLLPLLPPPRVFVFEAPFLLCTTGKGNGQEEFYLLTVPETRWNPSPRSGAGRSVLSVSPLHLSPPPSSRAPSFQRGRVGRCAPSPSLLLIGAQVGESPPRAYVRVRAVLAHLAFELRRFWLSFTSFPAFSAWCCARRGSSGKATGGGGRVPRP